MWNKKTAAFVVLAFVLLTSHADARDVRQVSLATNDIIYDPVTHKLYASVPGSAGAGIGNTITLIDPLSGAIGPSIFVGSEPGRLALPEDGRFLDAAPDGAAAVRRVDMASLTADLQFTLGSDSFFGPHYVEDMEVLPGNPFSVAISRKYLGVSPRHAGVAVYDDGVPRPTATPGHTGSNVIEFSANVSRLYGYNNETTDYGFRRMALAPTGVTIVDSTSNVIEGFNVDIEYHAGRVYLEHRTRHRSRSGDTVRHVLGDRLRRAREARLRNWVGCSSRRWRAADVRLGDLRKTRVLDYSCYLRHTRQSRSSGRRGPGISDERPAGLSHRTVHCNAAAIDCAGAFWLRKLRGRKHLQRRRDGG